MNSLKATIIGTLLILPFPFIEAARPVPFTVDEMMSLLEIKGWKYERLYREPVKGITLSIVVGSPAPGGGIIERQMPQPFGYHPPSGQTRYVVGLVLLESKRQFRLMIDDIAMEVDMPADFKYDYQQGFINGVEDGELLILAFNAKNPAKASKSKYDMASYFALKITPTK
jgi:hypothetical protein